MASIVALGVYRDVAEHTSPLFEGRPWTLAAVLDLQDARYGYSAHNLGVTLRTLSPRPKGLIVGLAISEAMSAEAQGVFNEYVKECKIEGAYSWKVSFWELHTGYTGLLTRH